MDAASYEDVVHVLYLVNLWSTYLKVRLAVAGEVKCIVGDLAVPSPQRADAFLTQETWSVLGGWNCAWASD